MEAPKKGQGKKNRGEAVKENVWSLIVGGVDDGVLASPVGEGGAKHFDHDRSHCASSYDRGTKTRRMWAIGVSTGGR
jgi:hypothetical protein